MNDMKRKNPQYDFYQIAPFLNTMKNYYDMYYDKLVEQFISIVLKTSITDKYTSVHIPSVTFYN
jgi:hypothetical protein